MSGFDDDFGDDVDWGSPPVEGTPSGSETPPPGDGDAGGGMSAGKRTLIIAAIAIVILVGFLTVKGMSVGVKETPVGEGSSPTQVQQTEGAAIQQPPAEGIPQVDPSGLPTEDAPVEKLEAAEVPAAIDLKGKLLLTTAKAPTSEEEILTANGMVKAKNVATDQNGQYYFVAEVLLSGSSTGIKGDSVNVVLAKGAFDALGTGTVVTVDYQLTGNGGVVVQKVDTLKNG